LDAEINEIFESIQGEGIFVGVRQLFIRFSKCNLKCVYCDTPRKSDLCRNYVSGTILNNPVSSEYVSSLIKNVKVHSISFTGGEPLLYADFIASLEKTRPFYLETNMTLPDEAKKIKDIVDYVAGDFKIREALPSADYDEVVENTIECFRILRHNSRRVTFCKIILPEEFDVEEVINNAESVKDYVICFVLQPVFGSKNIDILLALQKKLMDFSDTRIVPQVHKYLGVR